MVSVTSKDNEFIFDILGSHKFWALENTIKVPKNKIIRAYQSNDEFTFWIG
ncbi:MAG: hypothetical protein H7195_12335 [Chryseobacterium sp.]|nr:hypothetical protein [Chryseobacterium sp.]